MINMAIGKIKTTYEIITPESAEIGDAEERGWEDEEGVEIECVAEAVEFLIDKGVEQGNIRDYYSVDPDRDYQTGGETYYGYHLHGFSDEQMEEIDDLLNECYEIGYQKCVAKLRWMMEECEMRGD